MKDELLVDYLEEAAEYLRERREKLREFKKQYEQLYDKDIREEMDILNEEMGKKKTEIVDKLYENADELRYIKKYYPDFFEILLDDDEIGPILRKKEFLYTASGFEGDAAVHRLVEITNGRRRLKDAKNFLESWHGTITEKQLTATYPILKGKIKGSLDSADVIAKINELDKELKKEGWVMIVSSKELIAQVVQKFIIRVKRAEMVTMQAKAKYNHAKGKGSVTEYSALKILKKAGKREEHLKRMIGHLLLANPEFLSALKKQKGWLERKKKSELEKFAENVGMKKVREKTWLEKMNKKLS